MESLLVFRKALASPTMCRFIPALSVPEKASRLSANSGCTSCLSPGFGMREVKIARTLGCRSVIDRLRLAMLSIRPLPGFRAWIDGLKDEMVRGVVLKHFHFYSAQASVEKCVFS
jgi:hypothetical protein